MKKILFIIVLFMGLSGYAQVGVGTSNPDASAQLDVVSTNKGILIPRMKLTGTSDVTTIANPKESLLVYNTATAGDVVPGFYYWNSLKWVTLAGGLSGNVAIDNGGTGATTAPDALANLGAQSVANITTVLGTTLDHYPSESAVTTYVDAEATRAATVESGLQNQVFTEVSRATAAEATLQTAVALKASTADITAAVAAETTRADGVEVGLQIDLALETTRALGAETTLQADLATETARATTAEFALQTAVALKASTADVTAAVLAESNRAVTAEGDELTRALAAEAALLTAVFDENSRAVLAETTETTRATGVEATLQADLTAETTRAITAEALKENLVNKTTVIDATADDVLYPSALAVKNAVAAETTRAIAAEALKEDLSNKTTVINGTATDVLYPSALAVKTYVDAVPSFYGADGALTTARTVTQNNNDLTFTTGTAKLVVDGTLKLNGAVVHSFATTAATTYTVPNTINTIVYTGGVSSVFTMPAAAANAGLEIKIFNVSGANVTFAAGTFSLGTSNATVFTGTGAILFSDGAIWHFLLGAL